MKKKAPTTRVKMFGKVIEVDLLLNHLILDYVDQKSLISIAYELDKKELRDYTQKRIFGEFVNYHISPRSIDKYFELLTPVTFEATGTLLDICEIHSDYGSISSIGKEMLKIQLENIRVIEPFSSEWSDDATIFFNKIFPDVLNYEIGEEVQTILRFRKPPLKIPIRFCHQMRVSKSSVIKIKQYLFLTRKLQKLQHYSLINGYIAHFF